MNIRVDLNTPIRDGMDVKFRSPVDCSQITGLIVCYNGESKEFAFADAHGNNVGDIDHLFAENVVVKVILDFTTGMAFVQNADTNAYLEGRFQELEEKIGKGGGGSVADAVLYTEQDITEEQQEQARKNIGAMQNGIADTDLDMQLHKLKNVRSLVFDFGENSKVEIGNYVENGPRVGFGGIHNGAITSVGLSNIADGMYDNDAATVGQLKASMATNDYVLLAETITTEDVSQISWTQCANGEPLTNYKDFFIYWVGKFDKEVSSEAWICNANGGSMYYGYTYLAKRIDIARGFWWDIKELHRNENTTIWRFSFPSEIMGGFSQDFSYTNQGLDSSAKAVKAGICCTATGNRIEQLRIGSLSTGSKMLAGSKALLLGRKR